MIVYCELTNFNMLLVRYHGHGLNDWHDDIHRQILDKEQNNHPNFHNNVFGFWYSQHYDKWFHIGRSVAIEHQSYHEI